MRRCESSQFYCIIGAFSGGNTLPLLYAFLPDAKEETYKRMFAFLWAEVQEFGGQEAFRRLGCIFLFDSETPVMNATAAEMCLEVKG
ncbi:hypothetical protein Y032_0006g2907 [Ancylostoma ceylanicum]|uniref:MULE transposase domain-containing protein n=1 Tax=Ancylostoma ceylanicum TaxID=53326 RepID=A0A016VR99_9BILA|nr:hypothetical protein Y032_0006g2907 [Ancylostoma ceylanicum]